MLSPWGRRPLQGNGTVLGENILLQHNVIVPDKGKALDTMREEHAHLCVPGLGVWTVHFHTVKPLPACKGQRLSGI